VVLLHCAGILLSGLSHADMADDSGWAIYNAAAAVHRALPPLADDTTKVRLVAAAQCCCYTQLSCGMMHADAIHHNWMVVSCRHLLCCHV
jgi:delta-aminolevulinic acid dehydratase/porphobilinogen synthase